MGYIFLCMALCLNAIANILIKIGAGKIQEGNTLLDMVRNVLTIPELVGGVVLFALNVILYMLALTKLPLTIGYPVMTIGGLFVISLFSVCYLQETLTPLQMVGLGCMTIGVLFVSKAIIL